MSHLKHIRVRIITSCTGEKAYSPEDRLTRSDFLCLRDQEAFAAREQSLAEYRTSAESLYTGLQHIRLMEGVKALREKVGEEWVDLWILSAGYGLISGNRQIVPYECTFHGMRPTQINAWSEHLGIPETTRALLAEPADLLLVLLGEEYLQALQLDETMILGAPTVVFTSEGAKKHIHGCGTLVSVVLTNQEAKRFSCALVGLKGEVTKRLLQRLVTEGESFLEQVLSPGADILELLTPPQSEVKQTVKVSAVHPNPEVDFVVPIPASWWEKEQRTKLRYFIPEWHDMVDPDYNFIDDCHSGGRGDWCNEVYAHQLYSEPNYDGILVSKIMAEQNEKKAARINELGVHRLLRVPQEFPILGDCGAFGYIMQEKPPYTTDEILDYYSRLGFNYGVSIDHLIVSGTEQWKQERYDLTIHNAAEFLREHRKAGLSWEPVGAIQGWDPKSYAEAARQYVAMGYRYIALGGLVRSSTDDILRILSEVHEVVPETVSIHLFGIARISALSEFVRLGVRSIDSASYLRQAWEEEKENYFTLDGTTFAAIRVPPIQSPRTIKALKNGFVDKSRFEALERAALTAIRRFDRGQIAVEEVLDTLDKLDHALNPSQKSRRSLNRRTLESAPWRSCPCDICRRDGVEVIIFRGNNRNRRRGFHNTYIFYQLVQKVLAGECVSLGDNKDALPSYQLSLFELAASV